MDKFLCFYHGNCADGFTSAWIVHNYFKKRGVEVEFVPSFYQEAPAANVDGKIVYIVDFSFPKDTLYLLCERAKKVVLLDHHKTAEEAVSTFVHPKFEKVFDMERSGAGIVWDYFHAGRPRPQLVNYIEDRDLWKFKLPHSREAAEIYFSKEYTFENWETLSGIFEDTECDWLAVARGIKEYKEKSYKEMAAASMFKMNLGGARVIIANLPYMWGSDCCHYLCDKYNEQIDCAAYYWDSETHRNFGLRSIGEFDVSAIAKKFGGGGHKNAAGFKIWLNQVPEFMKKGEL